MPVPHSFIKNRTHSFDNLLQTIIVSQFILQQNNSRLLTSMTFFKWQHTHTRAHTVYIRIVVQLFS